ncbi:hypothetical protein FRB99_005181 [Tulasnella sp. 403]|nr:hypothetical protein FRB99_005181 [Tulasnella sp. 403]
MAGLKPHPQPSLASLASIRIPSPSLFPPPSTHSAPSNSSFLTLAPSAAHSKTSLPAKDEKLADPTPSSSISSLAETEKGYGWEVYEDDILPDKSLPKPFRNLRYIVLNIYRRLFTVCFLANVGVAAWVVTAHKNSVPHLGTIIIGNIFASVLIRQDNIVNGLFYLFTSVPHFMPLWVRTTVARVYSLGGIHSGTSVAATAWLFYFTVQLTRDVHKCKASFELGVVTYLILMLLVTIVVLAMPAFRRAQHNTFEMVHRFLGWTATGLLWAQVVLLIRDYKEPTMPLHIALRNAPTFWLVVILTFSITTSWLHLRKVKVQSEVLSNHALKMTVDYATPVPGSFARLSTSPLLEWHSFATITVPGRTGFSMIVSRAGDWTGKVIAQPPSEIWVRSVPTFGVMNIVPLFRRLVIVATGSGIAPCAPHVYAKRTEIKLLWVSRNIRKTYGDTFVDSILEASPDAIIYDTDARGRPDMVKLVHHVYQGFNAEAVCIIANQPITEKVVYGLMTRGVPAFGAIWDS